MSQILRDLNKLAETLGAPVIGQNISEQVRALSTHFGSTSHGANIAERINELRHGSFGGSSIDHSVRLKVNDIPVSIDDGVIIQEE